VIPIARAQIGPEEEAAVLNVMRSGMLAQGAQVAAFEQGFAEVCRVCEAIAVSSGTAALHLALLAHEVGPGDEVITSPFSFAATGNTILLVGATPIFVDIDPDTYNLDPEQVAHAITPRTKAIMPVHLYGNPANMGRLVPLAEAHGLVIIEDACQAHAAAIHGKPVGSFGTGAFSFYPTNCASLLAMSPSGGESLTTPRSGKRIVRSARDGVCPGSYTVTSVFSESSAARLSA